MAKGVQTKTHETRRPSLKLMVTPFVAHPGSIDRHPTPYKGRKPRRGMTEEMETPPGIRFDDTINKRTIDGVEAPNGGTRRAKMQAYDLYQQFQKNVRRRRTKAPGITKSQRVAQRREQMNPSSHGWSRTLADRAKVRHPLRTGRRAFVAR